jgi:hypothetical protein
MIKIFAVRAILVLYTIVAIPTLTLPTAARAEKTCKAHFDKCRGHRTMMDSGMGTCEARYQKALQMGLWIGSKTGGAKPCRR